MKQAGFVLGVLVFDRMLIVTPFLMLAAGAIAGLLPALKAIKLMWQRI